MALDAGVLPATSLLTNALAGGGNLDSQRRRGSVLSVVGIGVGRYSGCNGQRDLKQHPVRHRNASTSAAAALSFRTGRSPVGRTWITMPSAHVNVNNSITVSGTVDIDSNGMTTLSTAGNINAGGAVTFGAAGVGALNTAADITTGSGDYYLQPGQRSGQQHFFGYRGPGAVIFPL